MSTGREPSTVAEIVARLTRVRPDSVEHVPTNEDNRVYRITAGDGTLFFKSESASEVSISAWAYERAREAGVPVPDVLEVDMSSAAWPEPYMLMTGCRGVSAETIGDPDARSHVAREAGRIHRLLHSVVLDGFGYIDPEAGRGTYDAHPRLVHAFGEWGMSFIRHHRMLTERELDTIQRVLDRHTEIAPPPQQGVLVHGDAGLDHVFCDPSTLNITGLIDFEPKSADPAVDLAVFGYHYPEALDAFLAGYEPQIEDLTARMDLYRMTRGLGVVRWNHEHGFAHEADLENVRVLSARLHALLG